MSSSTTTTGHLWHVHAAGVVLCAAITLVGFLVVGRPALQAFMDRASLQAQVTDHQQQVVELELVRKRLNEQLERVERELDADRLTLQGPDFLNTRMAVIVEAASNSRIVIDESRSGSATAGPLFQTVPIHLSGTGSYPGCAVFLRELHQQLPDTGVVTFELNGTPGAAVSAGRFRFSLAWYAAPGP